MRFEGKHCFFERVVQDTQNFKTLATRHQYMMAYHLSAPSFVTPQTQTSNVNYLLVLTLPELAEVYIWGQTTSSTIYTTSKVTVDGTDYAPGMFVSVLVNGGLPQLCKIAQIYLVNNHFIFSAVTLSHGM